MNKLTDILTGTKILEEVESPINGKLTVIRDLAWGTYIKAGGVTQSGGILKKVWETTLKKINNFKFLPAQVGQISNCLILGLGGGSLAKLIGKYWPQAKITGVDVDPIMIDLGKKYLGLDKVRVKIEIQDAFDFISVSSLPAGKVDLTVKQLNSYNLICIDLYIGDQFPKKFESDAFLKLILKLLTNRGVAIFNRLYGPKERTGALKFAKKLEKIFPKVEYVYPEANIMFICYV